MDLPEDPGRVGLAMEYQGLQSLTSGPAAGKQDDLEVMILTYVQRLWQAGPHLHHASLSICCDPAPMSHGGDSHLEHRALGLFHVDWHRTWSQPT